MNDAWDALAGFESRDLISRFFKKRHGLEANAGKIREIASAFTQGREYFTSASTASISVKPLLLYYGVLSLSRALVLFSSPNLRESSLKPSHGLEVRNWQQSLLERNFANLDIRILNGTFSELLNAVNNTSYFRVNTSAVNWNMPFEQPTEGQTVLFYELASGFPDLQRELMAWSNNEYSFGLMNDFKQSKGDEYSCTISMYIRNMSDKTLESIFPIAVYPHQAISTEGHITHMLLSGDLKKLPRFVYSYDGVLGSQIGNVNLVSYLPNSTHLCDIGQFFMAAYVIGMMSRYFPTTWISLGRTEKGDVVYPFLLKMIKYIEKYFPQVVLDHLDAPYDFETKSEQQAD